MLKLASKFGVVLMVALLFTAPTMACLLPNATLTQAERDCCKHMAEQCGDARMPSSHSCCQRVSAPDVSNFVVRQAQHMFADLAVIGTAFPVVVQAVLTGGNARADWFDRLHGPPESPPAAISALRI